MARIEKTTMIDQISVDHTTMARLTEKKISCSELDHLRMLKGAKSASRDTML